MSLLFIADLHLQEKRPDITRAFLHFLETRAGQADALYILGDLFEAWIGDDFRGEPTRHVLNALKAVTDKGTDLYLMHGNRDFLLGEQFAQACGAQLLPAQMVITPYDIPLLIMHGDSLCTEDHAYQAFRQQVRSAHWQQAFLAKTLAERQAIGEQLRTMSHSQNQQKQEQIMDVTPAEVERVMDEAKVNILIHGHTHRPAEHRLKRQNQDTLRIVLGDWNTQGWVLEWHADNSHCLESFPIE